MEMPFLELMGGIINAMKAIPIIPKEFTWKISKEPHDLCPVQEGDSFYSIWEKLIAL